MLLPTLPKLLFLSYLYFSIVMSLNFNPHDELDYDLDLDEPIVGSDVLLSPPLSLLDSDSEDDCNIRADDGDIEVREPELNAEEGPRSPPSSTTPVPSRGVPEVIDVSDDDSSDEDEVLIVEEIHMNFEPVDHVVKVENVERVNDKEHVVPGPPVVEVIDVDMKSVEGDGAGEDKEKHELKVVKTHNFKKPNTTASKVKLGMMAKQFNRKIEHDFVIEPCHHYNFDRKGCNREPTSIHGNYVEVKLHCCFDCFEIASAVAFHRRRSDKCPFRKSK